MKPDHLVFVLLAGDYMTAVGAFSLIISEMNRFSRSFHWKLECRDCTMSAFSLCSVYIHVYSGCIYVGHICKTWGIQNDTRFFKALDGGFRINSTFGRCFQFLISTRTSPGFLYPDQVWIDFWDQVSYSNSLKLANSQHVWMISFMNS